MKARAACRPHYLNYCRLSGDIPDGKYGGAEPIRPRFGQHHGQAGGAASFLIPTDATRTAFAGQAELPEPSAMKPGGPTRQ